MANRIIRLAGGDNRATWGMHMLLHNAYNADDTALAIVREKAFQDDRFDRDIPNERSTRYRDGDLLEAVASLLDPFQPDSDEASRLANRPPERAKS